jgi:serine O-acetyltransferase
MIAVMDSNKDAIWERLRDEVDRMAKVEPMMASYLHATVLNHRSLEDSLSFLLAGKLHSPDLSAMSFRDVIDSAFAASDDIRDAIRRDLRAVVERDPAAGGIAEPFLHFKGFQALEAHRVAHWLWLEGRRPLALYCQSRISESFAVDIHPAARMGKGILIDHGTGVVIGETAVVGDDVSMLHEVTLGGTGKQTGDRHPKIGKGVLIGAGAKILGNIRIGDGSKIGAGSVVLADVPAHSTAAGVPARIVGHPTEQAPALAMDQNIETENG